MSGTQYGVIAHNLVRWTTRIGLGEPVATTKTLRRRFFSLAGRRTRKARRLTLHLPQGWPWQNQFSSALARLRALPLPPDHVHAFCSSTEPPNCLADLRQAGLPVSLTPMCTSVSPVANAAAGQKSPSRHRHARHPYQSVGTSALLTVAIPSQLRVACPLAPLRWIWAYPAASMRWCRYVMLIIMRTTISLDDQLAN
ncbi:MAG: transposase [Gemmatimonadota bacterium]|nr:transposase [Gemmatimonadota bacterium]